MQRSASSITGFARRITAVGATLVILSGCAGTAARFNDPGDVCNAQRQPLISASNHFVESIAVGGLFGAALGAGSGAAIAAASGGDVGEGAIAGAVIGLLGGLIAGALDADAQNERDREELLRMVNTDASIDQQQLGQVARAVANLNNCRARQVAQLRADVEAGTVDSATARNRLAAIRARVDQDNELVNEVLGDVSNRNDEFVEASAELQGVEAEILRQRYAQYNPRVIGGAAGGTTTVRTASNLRAGPSTSSSVLTVVQPGQSVRILGDAGNGWSRVQVGRQQGFISRSLLGQGGGGAPRSSGPVVASLPTVDVSARPATETTVEENLVQTAELQATQDAQYDALSAEMDDLDAFLAPLGEGETG